MPCYKHFYTIKNTIEIKDDVAKEYDEDSEEESLHRGPKRRH